MILQALLLSTVFLASNNPSYNYGATVKAQCSFASTYDTDAYADNICQFTFSTYYNDDEDYVSYLSRIDLSVNLYDSDDDPMQSYTGYYVFDVPVEFDIYNDYLNVSYVFDGSDLDYRFTYNNVQYLVSIENFYFNSSERTALPFPTINFSQLNLTTVIRSSLEGYNYSQGYDSGYEQGDADGYARGHSEGYVDGIEYAQSQDQTALTIFTGICTVAMLPVNMFLTIFNFEVFGINIGGFISSFLTIAIVIIVIRMITGKKSDD